MYTRRFFKEYLVDYFKEYVGDYSACHSPFLKILEPFHWKVESTEMNIK